MKANGEISSVNNQILSNTLRWLRHRRLNRSTKLPTNRHDLSIYQNQIFTSSITLVDPIMGPEKKHRLETTLLPSLAKHSTGSELWFRFCGEILEAGTRLRKAVKCFWKSFFLLSPVHVSFFISLASYTNSWARIAHVFSWRIKYRWIDSSVWPQKFITPTELNWISGIPCITNW